MRFSRILTNRWLEDYLTSRFTLNKCVLQRVATLWRDGKAHVPRVMIVKGLYYEEARNLYRMELVKFHTIFWLVDVYCIREQSPRIPSFDLPSW
jgi:hypothetical protein